MSRPVSFFHFSEVVGITAAPPPIATRKREKSTSPMFGCATSPLNNVLTPANTVQRSAAGKHRTPLFCERLADARHVARMGQEPVFRADREIGDEIHHQREDVI